MLQQTALTVNHGPDYVCSSCGQPLSCCRCSGRHISTRTHNAAAVGHGLGTNPAKMEGRRNTRSIAAVWEQAIKYFGLNAEEIAQAQAAEAEKAERHEEDSRVAFAEIEAGKAAFLAGIAYDDTLLTKLGRQGWQAAERDYRNGYRLFGGGMEVSVANRALRAGWEAARTESALVGMVAL